MAQIEVIAGPTASGKSVIAMTRAIEDPSIEIVNADASALYIEFDIGTAKPSKEEQARVRHHLISILEPHIRFSAYEYSEQARKVIRDILQRGKTPLVVGGTGFYIDALFFGLIPNTATEGEITRGRERAASEIASFGFDAMHAKLRDIDPELYSQINRERNPIRLQRAWEYYYATGEALGEARMRKTDPFEHEPKFTVIDLPRKVLWERIEERTDVLLSRGWVDEVRALIKSGVTLEMPAMRAIGYREITEFLAEKISYNAMRDLINFGTRQYAKRQSTWFRRYLRSTENS